MRETWLQIEMEKRRAINKIESAIVAKMELSVKEAGKELFDKTNEVYKQNEQI